MNKILKIKLMSPLCAATGEHYAAAIDLDTALTDCGVPYIPSKRLKGILREEAEMILSPDRVNEIFGETGKDKCCGFRISDATVDGIEIYTLPDNVNSEQIADLFCSVRAETAIDKETGTAKDKSLRFTRVVDRISPITNDNLVFNAHITFQESDEDDIKKIVKCLRNIGYKRNRGFGSVLCELTDCTKSDTDIPEYQRPEKFESDTDYEIKFTIKALGDIMLPSANATHSADYIPGSAVRGLFAARYDGDNFNDIFFSKDVKFGNAYISDEIGTEYFPSPHYLAKEKATQSNTIYNLISVTDFSKKQYKPLKDGYFNFEKGIKHLDAKIVYHNANTKSDDKNLYMQYCLAAGQYFTGIVTAKGDKAKIIADILEKDCFMYFGRSKTAQYARCRLIKIDIKALSDNTIILKAGKPAVAILESDLCLVDGNGIYTPTLSAVCSALNIAEGTLLDATMITGGEISGYNAKRNLKNMQFSVISAGSSIAFTPDKDMIVEKVSYYGEDTSEGFGRIRFYSNANTPAEISFEKNADNKSVLPENIKNLIEINRRIDDMLSYALSEYSKIKLNATQTGRITLMAKQAENRSDFENRVSSIKTDKTRNDAEKLYCFDGFKKYSNDWPLLQKYIVTVLNLHKYELRKNKKGEKK